jgi:hypothetical protein
MVKYNSSPEVVDHFQFSYQSLKNCNVLPQSFKKFQFKHSVEFDRQTRRNFDHSKTTSFFPFRGELKKIETLCGKLQI